MSEFTDQRMKALEVAYSGAIRGHGPAYEERMRKQYKLACTMVELLKLEEQERFLKKVVGK